jgi:hypothetical protein
VNARHKPAGHETELVGEWHAGTRKITGDATCQRIDWLVSCYLLPLGADPAGWDELYRDPESGLLWERTWPRPEMHGGGPPRLSRIEAAAARAKYGHHVDG